MRFTITDTISELEQHIYTFWFRVEYARLILDEYEIMTRETKRHKFKTDYKYNRILTRSNSLERKDITIPAHIKQQAIDTLISKITIED